MLTFVGICNFLQMNFTHYKQVPKLLETFDISKRHFEIGQIIFRFEKPNVICKKRKVYLSKKNQLERIKLPTVAVSYIGSIDEKGFTILKLSFNNL